VSAGFNEANSVQAPILELLRAGGWKYVPGDRDLIELGEDEPLSILPPRGFWDLLRADSAQSE
jgi:hypothetical protein